MTRIVSGFALLAASCLAPGISFAHHSVAGFFDSDKNIEIEGVLTKVRWRNPHTVFQIEATDESGEITTWTIESGALGVLRSRGLAREFVQVGDHIKVYGNSSFSEDMHLLERFTPNEDGSRLDYRLTVTDPNTFTETHESGRHWDWRPEIVVGAYDCDQDQRL